MNKSQFIIFEHDSLLIWKLECILRDTTKTPEWKEFENSLSSNHLFLNSGSSLHSTTSCVRNYQFLEIFTRLCHFDSLLMCLHLFHRSRITGLKSISRKKWANSRLRWLHVTSSSRSKKFWVDQLGSNLNKKYLISRLICFTVSHLLRKRGMRVHTSDNHKI